MPSSLLSRSHMQRVRRGRAACQAGGTARTNHRCDGAGNDEHMVGSTMCRPGGGCGDDEHVPPGRHLLIITHKCDGAGNDEHPPTRSSFVLIIPGAIATVVGARRPAGQGMMSIRSV